jgi:integrase
VNFNQDLSNKKDDDYNDNLNNTISFKSKNLLNIKRYLKKYDLLNNKNLIMRENIYYFSFYLEKDKNVQYSLKIKDFLLANIIKYKIILKLKEEIKKMNFEDEYLKQFNTSLTILKNDNSIIVNADNDEEKSLIENITKKTINTIKKSKIKKINSNVEIKSTRKSRNNIKKHIDLYINYLKLTNKNKKTVDSYIKKFDVLIDYFNYKNILSLEDVNKKHCKDLELYLLNFPSNLNKYEELKDKNIFELIDKKNKILDKYEKLEKRTIDSYITRYKTLFNYFLDNDYIYNNYFMSIKKMADNSNNSFKNFIDKEDTYASFEKEEVELLLKNIEDIEIKRSMIISLALGLRISEIFNLKKEDIQKSKDEKYYINVLKSKTKSGIRTIPLNSFFNIFINDILKDKKDNDFLFFKDEKKENRNDILQKKISRNIRKYIKNKNKVFHSFRKTYTQILYKNEVEELYIKIFLGHSLKDNLSFNTYNLSKINNKLLSSVIQKVDFNEFFENIDFFEKEKEKTNKKQDFGLSIF